MKCVYKNQEFCNRCECCVNELEKMIPELKCEHHCPYAMYVYPKQEQEKMIIKFYKRFRDEDVLVLAKRLYLARKYSVSANDEYDLMRKGLILSAIYSNKSKCLLKKEELIEGFYLIQKMSHCFSDKEEQAEIHCA